MENYNFVINIESDNISILKKDDGIVLSEPAYAIINTKLKKDNVAFVGTEAKDRIGKLPKEYMLVKPISNGKIVDFEVCTVLVDRLLSKVEDSVFFKKRSIVFLVPCGLDERNLKLFRNLGYTLSCKYVKLVPKVIANSLIDQTKKDLASMQIILEDDYIDIAVLYNNRIINGHTIELGGNIIDKKIINYIENNYGLNVEEKVLEKIKSDMATIIPNDIIINKYRGFDSLNQMQEFVLNSLDLNDIYISFTNEVADIIDTIMRTYTNEVIAELNAIGAYVSGKMVNITGLEKFLANRLDMDICIAEKSRYIGLLGISSILHDSYLIEKLAIN